MKGINKVVVPVWASANYLCAKVWVPKLGENAATRLGSRRLGGRLGRRLGLWKCGKGSALRTALM